MNQKQLYAQAILSHSMTKAAAFLKYINPNHRNPAQGAYKLEHTQYMQRLMRSAGEELERIESIRGKQLLITDQSLDILKRLLDDCEHKSPQEQLATLRLVKGLTRGIEATQETHDDIQQPTERLNIAGIID